MHSVLFLSVLVATKIEIMRLSVLFSDEDLYRGAEELTASQDNGAGFLPPCQSISTPSSFFFLVCLIPLRVTGRGCQSISGTHLPEAIMCSGCHIPTLVLIFFFFLSVKCGGQVQPGSCHGYSVLQREGVERKHRQKCPH